MRGARLAADDDVGIFPEGLDEGVEFAFLAEPKPDLLTLRQVLSRHHRQAVQVVLVDWADVDVARAGEC